MGLFKKKTDIHIEESGERTPVKFTRGRERSLDKKTRFKKAKRIIIFTLVFAILGGGAFFGFRAYNSLKNIFAEGSGNFLNLFGGSQGQQLKGEANGRVNILLLGVGDEEHSGSTLSDTIIIMSLDTRTKNVAMFSIPRDLYVQIPNRGYSKINGAHAYGEQEKPGNGPIVAKETIEKTFNTTIHYYVRVDFSGLQKVVDSLGGVTIDVENAFCDYNYPTERPGDTRTICFKKGTQTMNGTKALQYSRSRHAYGPEGSDFARSRRQQKLLVAIKDKMLSVNTVFNPKKVLDLLSALGDHVKTDFQPVDFPRLFELSKNVDSSKIINKNFDNSPEGLLVSSSSASAGYTLQPRTGNFKEIQLVIKNIFDTIGVTNEKPTVSVYNGTYTEGLATKVGGELSSSGFTTKAGGQAESSNYIKTIIIDYSNGTKPESLRYLEKKFGVTATKPAAAETGTVNFKVIIGRDYRG